MAGKQGLQHHDRTGLNQKREAETSAFNATQKTTNTSRPGRILVADDNHDAREALSLVLRTLGYHVETARDGAAALELVHTFQPQLVILDVLMPGANGFKTAELLRGQPSYTMSSSLP